MKNREPRRRVVLAARSRVDGKWTDVSIRNISSRGMLLELATPIARGVYLEICRGRQIVVVRVVWSDGRHAGVHSQDWIDMDAIIARPDAPGRPRTGGEPERRWQARDMPRPARSVMVGAHLQKAALGVCGLAAAIMLASLMHETLSLPLLSVRDALATTELTPVAIAKP